MTGRKRLFLGLLCLSLLVLFALATFFAYLALNPQSSAYDVSVLIVVLVIGAVLLVFALGVLAVIAAVMSGRSWGRFGSFLLKAAYALYPAALSLGGLFGIPKDKIRASFVEVNNQLVRSSRHAVAPREVLILAPHCLQKSDCAAKLGQGAENCLRCGGCGVGGLLDLAQALGVQLAVVTGGTLARKFVAEFKPRAIVAVACERDLSAGIMDTAPLPVLGVGNLRPHGPCKNTAVELEKVEEAVAFFTVGR
ncbi:MAG: DUF116 domain-containing protein [Clostridiales bacterium]|nr:DUF116 domain-containing protein [Clostridiales bacterium]